MNLVGLRVLRGPDWNHGDIDGGDGHLGTIVNIGGLNTAQVLWDNGQQCVCRIGENNKHDLRIFDSGPVGVRHMDYICSSCSEKGIFGMRWQCKQCKDVHLCPVCYVMDKHDINHPFLRFDTPQSQGVEIPKRSVGVRCRAVGIFPGATVKRGRDWKWDNQDGGEGKLGEVLSIKNNPDTSTVRNVAYLKWRANGNKNSYRLGGIDGKVDLMFVEQSQGPFYYRDHLPLCMKDKALKGASGRDAAGEKGLWSDILREGDKVCITVSAEKLKKIQEEHGGYTTSMNKCYGKVGEIKGITQKGDVWVDFNGSRVRLFPGVLTKVYDFKIGDTVKILDDEEKVRNLQEGFCGYNETMNQYLGKVGEVMDVDSDGDLHIKFGDKKLIYNPMCCLPAPGEKVYEGGVEDDSVHIGLMSILLGLNNALMNMLMAQELVQVVSQSVSIATLFAVIAQEDLSMVRTVLNDSPELVNTVHQDMTPLFLASYKGHRGIVLELLKRKADVDKSNKEGITPLMASIASKNQTIGKSLIDNGANVNIVCKKGRTALHWAAADDCSVLVDMIIRNGGDVNLQDPDGDTALHDAISSGSDKSIVILCKATNPNPGVLNKKNFNVLHLACFVGSAFAVNKILDRHKLLVNVKNPDEFTALHIAVANNHTECAKLLIEKGNADVNMKGPNGIAPFHLAALEGYLDCVQLLIEKNADLNAVDGQKCSPLHSCCIGRRSTADRLAALLGIASSSKRAARNVVAIILIKNGARTDLENVNGKTPLQCCSDEDMKRCLSEFIRQRLGESSQVSSSNDMSSIRCMTCMSSTSIVALRPCGHRCVCQDCAILINACLICDQRVTTRGEKCCVQ